MEKRSDTANYHHLLQADIPLIDVRAPVEFNQGAMPTACNLPLMSDDERALIGICYQQHGQQAAVALGHSLVSGAIKTTRIQRWLDYCRRHPTGYLCCARGGLRSHIAQQWLHQHGVDYPLVTGGYKALRYYAMQIIETRSQWPMVIVSGNTGCGKTQLVRAHPLGVDLEGLAHHRGSSFGQMIGPQPPQANFENQLAITLLKKSQRPVSWVVEDEGRAIGCRHIPKPFREQMARSPIVVVEDPFEARLERLETEYFQQMKRAFSAADGEVNGWANYCAWLRGGLFAIRKRLGLTRYQQLAAYLEVALTRQQQTGSSQGHLAWLAPLLQAYYDPMYQFQLAKRDEQIIFRGNYQQVDAWLRATITAAE